MGTYDIIVLDLDGTLTNSQKKITPKTKDALMKHNVQAKKSYWHPADRPEV